MTFQEIINKSKDLSIGELKLLIGDILKKVNYGSIFCKNQIFEGLYRARQHNEFYGNSNGYLFTNEKEYWNPHKKYIKELGRCNEVGQSLFYCSNNFETSILEVRPEKDKFITVARFIPIKIDNKLPSFRIKPNCIQHLNKIEGINSCFKNFDLLKREESFIEVDNLLDNLFTEVVNDNEKFKYKITNAITQCMLTNIVNENHDEFSMNGMIYPSIINNKKSVNILLKPIYAINYFRIEGLQTFKILDVTEDFVKIKLIRNGYTVGKKKHPSIQLNVKWLDPIDGEVYNIERK